MRLITARNLSVTHGALPALHHVSLTLDAGEIVTIVGPNGAGKSTLLRALIGAVTPDAGSIERAPELRIGYVPQKLALDPTFPISVRRFLDLPQRVSKADATRTLDTVGLTDLAQRPLNGLSGGQFQRVLLARALLGRPNLLILDEATQGLDQAGSARFYQLIAEVRREIGCAVLMVSHELHVVMGASDRVICLNGHICCEGSPDTVTAAPAYRELFGESAPGLALYRHAHDHHHHHDHNHEEPV